MSDGRIRRWLSLPERASRMQREVDDELAFHLASRVAGLEQRGWSPAAARAEASASSATWQPRGPNWWRWIAIVCRAVAGEPGETPCGATCSRAGVSCDASPGSRWRS